MVLAAVAQICSRNNPAINLLVCKSVIKRAAGRGAEFLCLPEAADYIAPSDQGGLKPRLIVNVRPSF